MPASHRYSRRASDDLEEIGLYTAREWGEAHAMDYVDELDLCCSRLAEMPLLGRSCQAPYNHLRRFERGKHVIFYRQVKNGISIVRILHQRRVPAGELPFEPPTR